MEAVLALSDNLAEKIGGAVRRTGALIVAFLRFQREVLKTLPLIPLNLHFTVEQMYIIGITSIPLILITSTFTGAVFSYQMAYQLTGLAPDMYIGVAVGKSVMVELGPVLVSMVMCGRIGAAMCAELGTMAVTEQLDAMRCLNLSPHRYLLAPRMVASVIMLPVLTIMASLISILSGWFVAYMGRDLPFDIFMKGVRMFYKDWDMIVGLLKSMASGYIIAAYATFFGYNATHGAEGVGSATKASVVASMTSVLIAAFLLSWALL